MSMTLDEQRFSIAERMGYIWYRSPQDKNFPNKSYRFLALPQIQEYEGQLDVWKQRADGSERIINSESWKKAQGVDYVPNYPLDLNAMNEAEEKLTDNQYYGTTEKSGYLDILMGLTKGNRSHSATSQQRSEALCRTLWPERWER